LLVDTYGVTKSAIYQWNHELKQQMQPGVVSSIFTGAEIADGHKDRFNE
jgi:hypothetical protein